MLKRFRQFFTAISARILTEDREFIAVHLNVREASLFWRMSIPDQRHALNVAYTALDLAAGHQDIDKKTLIKAALLHDVGKVKGDVSTMDKVITVLLDKCAPAKARIWSRFGRGNKLANIRHALFIYYNHPARSAAFLKECGVSEKIAELAGRHHSAPTPGDSPELAILKKADGLN